MEKHRDLSELSALLAGHITPAPAKPKKARALAPANDNKPVREQLAWPAFERLAHRGDFVRAYALRHWKNMVFPHQIVIADDAQKYEPEVSIEIRPSEAELLAAVGWKVIDRERWAFTGEMMNTYADVPEPQTAYSTNRNGALEAQIGGLAFRDGELKQWGKTKKGAPLRPVERSRGVKGGSGKRGRTDGQIWSYIRLKGAVSPLTAQPYATPMTTERTIGDCYDPLPREAPSAKDRHGRYGVKEARQLLAQMGVDGSVPFDKLPHAATRCPDGLVSGDQWIGGIKQPKPTASEPAGREPEFVRQVETMDYVRHLRIRLGKHAKALDLAITDTSAKHIGVSAGHAPAYAEKVGPSLIDAAIDALIDIDEMARGVFLPVEHKVAA